jgi:hypothetical protein
MPKLKPNQFYLSNHLITELPIIFQTEMVQAKLEDRKNQTRRTRGLDVPADLVFDKIEYSPGHWPKKPWHFKKKRFDINGEDYYETVADFNCPYGKPGDLLWVKETFGHFYDDDGQYVAFKADFHPNDSFSVDARWRPSIHMPKEASRLWLMVEEIRPERVQDISEEDAINEGLDTSCDPRLSVLFRNYLSPRYMEDRNDWDNHFTDPIESFKSLWISINGPASWKSNPFVWRIKYRILSKTGRPDDETILNNYLQVKEKEVVHA